jgi:hypothetical protein
MAMNGADVLIYIEGNLVGSQRGVTFKESNEEIDYSSKDSRAFQGGPGRYKATLSLEALYVPTDAAYQALQDAMRDGTYVDVVRQEEGADVEEAEGFITSLSEEAPDQSECTVSCDITINGEWTATS